MRQNVIPGEAVFTIDMRDLDKDVIGKMSLRIENLCSEIQEGTGCVVQIEPQFEVIPTKSCPKLVSSSFHESEKLGILKPESYQAKQVMTHKK